MTAKIHYYDIGDYKTREEKLEILRKFKSIENVDWQTITPNNKHDWINQRDEVFDDLMALGDKGGNEETIFDIHSRGVATGRDAWVYNFSKKKLSACMKRMIDFYNEQVEKYTERKNWDNEITVDTFIDNDPTKIAWDRELKNTLGKLRSYPFEKESVMFAMYRPFCKSYAYFNRRFNSMVYQMPRIFPYPDAENMAICLEAPGGKTNFSTLITNTLPDLHLFGTTQCFPFYVYEKEVQSVSDGGLPPLFMDDDQWDETNRTQADENADVRRSQATVANGRERRDNITDAALQKFREHYKDNTISKRDIFYYIYGILNCRSYQERFAAELKKQLPRIPFANDFRSFVRGGQKLAELHLNYETLKPFPLTEKVTGKINYHVNEMKFPSKTDKTKIIYNSSLTLEGIPPETYRYVVNGKSALEWILERYKISTHKESNITNDPNDWCTENNNERYIVDLVKRIVTLSVESVTIIERLPELVF